MGKVGAEKALGVAIQAARKKAGLTQQELCHHVGMSYSTLAKIERGAIKAPSVFTVQLIAEATATSVESLVGKQFSGKSPARRYQRSKSGLTFVYFDLNGVLVRFFHRAFSAMAHDTGVSSDVIESAFWHFNDAICRGDMTMAEGNRAMARRMGVESIDWMQYYLEAVEPVKEAQEVMAWAAEHYRVGIISNTFPGFIDALQQRKILPEIPYTTIIDSSAVKAIKPESKIYKIATERAEVPAEEILFIDDARGNLMAAEKLGWRVMWFDDFQPKECAARIKKILEF